LIDIFHFTIWLKTSLAQESVNQNTQRMVTARVYYILRGSLTSHLLNMVPTAKEILFSRTFLGQIYQLPGQSVQDLKVINQTMFEKAYHINSMYDWLLIFLWYNLPCFVFFEGGVLGELFSHAIFCSGHFLILSGSGKWICYFPGCVRNPLKIIK